MVAPGFREELLALHPLQEEREGRVDEDAAGVDARPHGAACGPDPPGGGVAVILPLDGGGDSGNGLED